MNLEHFVKRHQLPVTAMESFHDIDHMMAWLHVSAESHELLCEKISQHTAFAASLEAYAQSFTQVGEFTQASLEHYELGLRAMFKAQELTFHDHLVPSLEEANEVATTHNNAENPGVGAKALEMAKKAIAYVIEQIKKLIEKAMAWFAKSRATDKLIETQANKAVQLLGNIKTPTVVPGAKALPAPVQDEEETGEPAAEPEAPAEPVKTGATAPRWMTYDSHFNMPAIVKLLQGNFTPPSLLATPNLFAKCTVVLTEQNYIGLTGMVQGVDTGSPQLVLKTLKEHHEAKMQWAGEELAEDKVEMTPIGEQQKSMLVTLAQKTEQLNGQRMQGFELFEKDFQRLMTQFNQVSEKQTTTGASPGPDAGHMVTMLNSVFTMYSAEDTAARGMIVSVLKALKPYADQGVQAAAA